MRFFGMAEKIKHWKPGRDRVGVDCGHGDCVNRERCKTVYNQDFLKQDGSCPHYTKEKP